MIKLTRQSEAIYQRLHAEFRMHVLTADELVEIRHVLEWKDSLDKLGMFGGAVRRFTIGAAIFAGSIAALIEYFPGLKKLLRLE